MHPRWNLAALLRVYVQACFRGLPMGDGQGGGGGGHIVNRGFELLCFVFAHHSLGLEICFSSSPFPLFPQMLEAGAAG